MAELPIDLTPYPIAELTNARLSFTVVDETATPIPDTSLDSLKLTLFNERDAAIINSREDLDILNNNNGVVDANGDGYWTMDEEDNPILAASPKVIEEYHIALFEWTYSAGNRTGRQPVRLKIINLQDVS